MSATIELSNKYGSQGSVVIPHIAHVGPVADLSEMGSKAPSYGFVVTLKDGGKLKFYADRQEAERWIKLLKDAVDEFYKKAYQQPQQQRP